MFYRDAYDLESFVMAIILYTTNRGYAYLLSEPIRATSIKAYCICLGACCCSHGLVIEN